jgi:hypothetical protein
MLTAIELHAPGAFDPDQFACWSLRRLAAAKARGVATSDWYQ